jgi:hypothetical protein
MIPIEHAITIAFALDLALGWAAAAIPLGRGAGARPATGGQGLERTPPPPSGGRSKTLPTARPDIAKKLKNNQGVSQ